MTTSSIMVVVRHVHAGADDCRNCPLVEVTDRKDNRGPHATCGNHPYGSPSVSQRSLKGVLHKEQILKLHGGHILKGSELPKAANAGKTTTRLETGIGD